MKGLVKVAQSTDVRIVVVAILYYVSAQLGLWLSFPVSKAAPLWPPAGIALALIILTGYRTWPAVTIGSLVANSLVFLNLNLNFSLELVSSLVVIAIGNTIEALFGYYLILKFIRTKNPFLKTIHVFIFLLVALVMCLIGSGVGSIGLVINGIIAQNDFLGSMSTWWISNVVSILIITPFVISWSNEFKFKWNTHAAVEWGVFISALLVIILILNFNPISETIQRSLPFLIVPFLLWLGFRFNLQITASGILLVSFLAIFFTIKNQGPFILEAEESSLLLLQIFIGIISISSIIIYATVHERTVAQRAMVEFNENLETKVKERTKELHEEIQMRKKTEEKIKVSNRKLRKANVELDNFVYSVSHDLRAPIASVLGLVNLAKQEEDIEMMRKYLSMVAQSAEQQDNFIKDILDLSRNSRLEVDHEEISFECMINEIFDQLKYSSKDSNVIKEIEIDQNQIFKSDQKRLKVVFNNLISNAIRYSNGQNPHIKISVSVDDTTAKVLINDNGVGIAKKHLKNVFKMFYRATEDNAGSGLGLYIVKETVEKLRGNIMLDSEENKGTTVSLEIPNLN
ncbi:GHKL domain-containing protein [Fulvivirga sp. M361]|uniref:MASE1 domain-containing protein n=1 Tax=Fulvivirga sp. M361 TaxID=2594266 RepID=UPI00117A76AA|nr:MASE1 domain-containing protein [Fulvivirga sp. M361]TRX56272.1 GHKL domain-containing protein [Fulvivirga sp. M361]